MSTAAAPSQSFTEAEPDRRRRRSQRAVGGALRGVFAILAGAFVLLAANSLFLAGVSAAEQVQGRAQQSYFSLLMLLAHIGGGLLLLPLAIYFIVQHARRGWIHRNRNAARIGIAQSVVAAILALAGVALTRIEWSGARLGLSEGELRDAVLWTHRLAGPLLFGLYLAHRQFGRGLRLSSSVIWFTAFLMLMGVFTLLHQLDPRRWNERFPIRVQAYFTNAETLSGAFIPAAALRNDESCAACHAAAHREWAGSAHRRSGLANPRYAAALATLRAAANSADATAEVRRCAACHEPVALFSGSFESELDNGATREDRPQKQPPPTGVGCISCHGVTSLGSAIGDGRYVIDEPARYPFSFSSIPLLRWLNHQAIITKPRLHRESMMQPLHQTAEFCAACHRQTLPVGRGAEELLRSKNHFDTYRDGPFSGRNVSLTEDDHAAAKNCATCHMPALAAPSTSPHRSHAFDQRVTPAAPVAQPPADALAAFDRSVTIDLFALRTDGDLDGELLAPLADGAITVRPGATYLLELVLKNHRVGHVFPGGAPTDRETWIELRVASAETPIASSGELNPDDGRVDPEAHFVGAWLVDAAGQRITTGHAESAVATLFDHQLAPGGADLVRYRLEIPAGVSDKLMLTARLLDRRGREEPRVVANTKVQLPLVEKPAKPAAAAATFDAVGAARWNDYGLALFDEATRRNDERERLRADDALTRAVELGSAEALLTLARIAIANKRQNNALNDALDFVLKARGASNPPAAWRLHALSGEIHAADENYNAAITDFRAARATDSKLSHEIGLQARSDAGLLRSLGAAQAGRAVQIKNGSFDVERLQREAIDSYEQALQIEPNHVGALRALAELYKAIDEPAKAQAAMRREAELTPNEDRRNTALGLARARDPVAARSAAVDIAPIYPLRPAK